MAGHHQHARGRIKTQPRTGGRRREPEKPLNRGRVLAGLLIAMGAVAAVVVADDEWAWRDSLRRMSKGEVIPAYRANEWADALAIREGLAEDLLAAELSPSAEDWEARRDLALYTLIVSAGDATITRGGASMGRLMEEICVDVDWLEEMTCFCPLEHAQKALPILAHIYSVERKRMAGMPANRRLASAIAFEFARAGLNEQAALESYLLYASSGQKQWLNNRFFELSLVQMRVIAARLTDAQWGNRDTISWFQRNNRLPARGYTRLADCFEDHQLCLLGTEVGSPAFMALYRNEEAGGTAGVYEASGCSTAQSRALYAATAACANGVPALVADNGSEAACMVSVNGNWELSAPVPEGAACSWRFCGQNHPDFMMLAAALGEDKQKTMACARLQHLGQFFYASGNIPQAHAYFREAVTLQPRNYEAWVSYFSAGASRDELDAAVKHFEDMPGVAAALRVEVAQ